MSAFESLFADAEAWLAAPQNEKTVARLLKHGRALFPHVPSERANDWKKLLSGFEAAEPDAKRRARVEGLARACKLFAEVAKAAPQKSPKTKSLAEKKPKAIGSDTKAIAKTPKIQAPEWSSPVRVIAGVGPKTAEALAEIGVTRAGELPWLLPIAWQDLRTPQTLPEFLARDPLPERAVISATVKSASVMFVRGRRGVRLTLWDEENGDARLGVFYFFLAHGILALAKPGVRVIASGRISRGARGALSMVHPDLFRDEPAARRLLPKYAVAGVKSGVLRQSTQASVRVFSDSTADGAMGLPDPAPQEITERHAMPDYAAIRESLARVHAVSPVGPNETDVRAVRERLAWVEAFARVWARLSATETKTRAAKLSRVKSRAFVARLEAELGFAWTAGQKKAVLEIAQDIDKDTPMRRLLLGDVGTGKTAVALAAIAQCVASKKQAVILAPTSILAEQYMDAVAPLARATGAKIALAVGHMQAAHKAKLAEKISAGAIDVVVGTHALFSAAYQFSDLALVVVDEQQRLGVAQRLSLVQKGKRPHLLSLSATPIPRTMMLALLGDIQMSTIDERPRGRPPVATELCSRARGEEIFSRVREVIAKDERVFIVAPRIEPDEDEDGEEANSNLLLPESARELAALFEKNLGKDAVLFIHGKMADKADVLPRFRRGDAKVLVGTTVLEVGIDVPDATLMIICGAERFGLSQLHQLRGRVGRGSVASTCILVHDVELEERARARLSALVAHDKGADIARIDLELRGAGDLSGTEQSGQFADFLYLDPHEEPRWLPHVEGDAKEIFARDPKLQDEGHAALSLMMNRFAKLLALREEAG